MAAQHVEIFGGGPAGLMAAQVLSAGSAAVTLHEAMPSLGRKFLMAGRGGLNLTHSEPFEPLVARFGDASEFLRPMLEAFTPETLQAWADDLGQETFVGSSGRVFPRAMKASPLLRAWLGRLRAQGVQIEIRSAWRGWEPRPGVPSPNATILALGGASWPRLGSDGSWIPALQAQGVILNPFKPANGGFDVAWSAMFRARFAGQPLKAVALSFAGQTVSGEAVVTDYGLEGGAVYALSAPLRDAFLATGSATLQVDLRPNLKEADIAKRLAQTRPGETLANRLRKAVSLSTLEVHLLREAHGLQLPAEAVALARAIKIAPLQLTGVRPLARAISSAGGVAFAAVGPDLQLHAVPHTYVVGEMLDWEAPTGGYLLQACLATGAWAARAILDRATR